MKTDKQTIIDTFQMVVEGKITNAHFADDGVVIMSKEHYAALFGLADALEIIDAVGHNSGDEWDHAVAAVRQAFNDAFEDQVSSFDGAVEVASKEETTVPEPVRRPDGSLHEFLLKSEGKSFRCSCGCNVFHKPDRTKPNIYQCNACEARYEGE